MEEPEELNQNLLDTTVEECLKEEGIVDLLEGSELRTFAASVLERMEEYGETEAELDQDFIEAVRGSVMKWNGPGSPDLPEELQWKPIQEPYDYTD
jgi:hypothetical protein